MVSVSSKKTQILKKKKDFKAETQLKRQPLEQAMWKAKIFAVLPVQEGRDSKDKGHPSQTSCYQVPGVLHQEMNSHVLFARERRNVCRITISMSL